MIFTACTLAAFVASATAFVTPSSLPRVDGRTATKVLPTKLSAMPYDDDKMPFYALGTNLAIQMGADGLTTILEPEELEVACEAFSATFKKSLSPADADAILNTYGPQLNEILQGRAAQQMDQDKNKGVQYLQDFLSANPSAVQTESGLVYLETQAGTGASPAADSMVEVHYHGTLVDGTVFDSSLQRGEPMGFPLNGVIPGWTEGLQLMKEGGKATLVVPSDLAYGDNGSGGVIPPGATLQFEVELLKVAASEPPPDMGEMEEVTLPDGTTMQVPKGVKVRMVDENDGPGETIN